MIRPEPMIDYLGFAFMNNFTNAFVKINVHFSLDFIDVGNSYFIL